MEKLSRPMITALHEVRDTADPKTGVCQYVMAATPGTIRALEKRGLVTCDRWFATSNVKLTPAGLDAAKQP